MEPKKKKKKGRGESWGKGVKRGNNWKSNFKWGKTQRKIKGKNGEKGDLEVE